MTDSLCFCFTPTPRKDLDLNLELQQGHVLLSHEMKISHTREHITRSELVRCKISIQNVNNKSKSLQKK